MNLRLLLVTLFSLWFLTESQSQDSIITVTRELTRPDNKNDLLHKVTNEFSTVVGKYLKDQYPMRVDRVSVKLVCSNGMMTLRYTAVIGPCSQDAADYNFDHRGSFSLEKTQGKAELDADKRSRAQKEEAVQKFNKEYGSSADGKPKTRVIDSRSYTSGCTSGYAGAITEHFLIVKRF